VESEEEREGETGKRKRQFSCSRL